MPDSRFQAYLAPLVARLATLDGIALLSPARVDAYRRDLDRILASPIDPADALCEWLHPDGWRCPRCGSRDYRRRPSSARVRICRACGAERSITSNTFLHGQRDLNRWLHAAAWLLAPRPGSMRAFARAYGCNPKTAFATFHRLHAARPLPPCLEGDIAAAFASVKGRPDQGPEELRVRVPGESDPPWMLSTVVWSSAGDSTAFPSEFASRCLAGDLLPADVSEDLPRQTRAPDHRAHAIAHWMRVWTATTHRAISPRWKSGYVRFWCWLADARSAQRSAEAILADLFGDMASRERCIIRALPPALFVRSCLATCPPVRAEWVDVDDEHEHRPGRSVYELPRAA